MWFLGRIRESLENIPQELGRYVGRGEEEHVSAKVSLSNKLHSNILTPGNIPKFCLPPRLTRGPLLSVQRPAAAPSIPSLQHASPPISNCTQGNKSPRGAGTVAWRDKKPPPFSAEGYGLAGMYESPNTRRKESLFHVSKCPGFTLDRTPPMPVPATRAEEPGRTANARSGPTASFPCKSLSETGSVESDAPSSNNSSPRGSPLLTRSRSSPALAHLLEGIEEGQPLLRLSGHSWGGHLSCLSLTSGEGGRRRTRAGSPLPPRSTTHPPVNCPGPSNPSANSLAPPLPFPLDALHCEERLRREHLLLLPGRGAVRLAAERTASPGDPSLSTVRVRVVSMEGLREEGDPRPLNCCLSLSLSPGKLQRQESATVRNCRSPVFNEDFFFTELSQESLLGLGLRLKVMDKPGHSALRRGAVLGVITEPLVQLLP